LGHCYSRQGNLIGLLLHEITRFDWREVHYQHFDVAFGFDQNTRPLLPLHWQRGDHRRRREYMLCTRHGKIIITTERCYQRKTGLIARGRNGSVRFSPAATTKIWIMQTKETFPSGRKQRIKAKFYS
jgi:hypothetical protein